MGWWLWDTIFFSPYFFISSNNAPSLLKSISSRSRDCRLKTHWNEDLNRDGNNRNQTGFPRRRLWVRRETVGCIRGDEDRPGKGIKLGRCSQGWGTHSFNTGTFPVAGQRLHAGKGGPRGEELGEGPQGRLEGSLNLMPKCLDSILSLGWGERGRSLNPEFVFQIFWRWYLWQLRGRRGRIEQDCLARNPVRNPGWESQQEVTKTPKPEAELR